MKGNQRIKLLKSQKILLQKQQGELVNIVQVKQKEFQETLNMIVIEQGVPEKEIHLWRLAEDMHAIEKIEKAKSKKNKGDKKSDRKNKDKEEEK